MKFMGDSVRIGASRLRISLWDREHALRPKCYAALRLVRSRMLHIVLPTRDCIMTWS